MNIGLPADTLPGFARNLSETILLLQQSNKERVTFFFFFSLELTSFSILLLKKSLLFSLVQECCFEITHYLQGLKLACN